MRKGESRLQVLTAVKARVALLNRSVSPNGVLIIPYYDRTWLIETTLKTVFKNLLEGALLVTTVLFIFLGNLRAAAIVALMIPLSLLATFIGLTWRGVPANLLSLGAMDFGIIVDGAVIVVENIFRKLSEQEHSTARNKVRDLILNAAAEVGRPTFFSMLIIIVAHIPIFTLQRHEGRIFALLSWTVTSALVGSLLFSLTLVPLLCWFLLRKNLPHKENAIMRFASCRYEPILRHALGHPKAVVIAALIALGASLALVPKLGTEFLPELNEGSIWINANFPPGLSVTEARCYCTRIQQLLHTVPEVKTVISKSGRPEDGTDPKPINMAECFVDLKPAPEWRKGMTKEKIIDSMDKALDGLPGVETSFSQPIRDNVLESISQIDGQVVIKVFGDDPRVLREQVTQVLRKVSGVQGGERAFIDRAGEGPQAIIEIDRDRASRYGLNVGDITDEIEIGLGGKAATELWEGEKHFSVLVRLAEPERGLANIRKILIDTPDCFKLPREEVATFKESSGSINISRENATRVPPIAVFTTAPNMRT